ncbi:MAG: fumarate hydratase [Syntrophales bacterium]|jgi:fumarate hydratase subunit alpha
MRSIPFNTVKKKMKAAIMEAAFVAGDDLMASFRRALEKEESPLGKETLNQLIENAEIARKERIPLCQDTGLAVFFVEMGDQVKIKGGTLPDALNEATREAYGDAYLRKSACNPFTRKNTGDNTPAIIHYDIVNGDKLKITFCAKGGGSENMSRVTMLKPSDGRKGVEDFVVQRVWEAQANPCPPIIVGVGIGGTFERAAIIAKKALLEPIGKRNSDPELAEMEESMLRKINDLGIGPGGLGGRITALDVHVIMEPCHIASLPLAVNINCHSSRHAEIDF